jgi:hypothetical protein
MSRPKYPDEPIICSSCSIDSYRLAVRHAPHLPALERAAGLACQRFGDWYARTRYLVSTYTSHHLHFRSLLLSLYIYSLLYSYPLISCLNSPCTDILSASIAPIVRLKFLIGMNDQSRFLQNLGSILAWASAEMNVGMLVANLPACRPLLERMISRFSSWTGSGSRSFGAGKKSHARGPSRAATAGASKQYLELDERPGSTTLQNYLKNGGKTQGTGVETRIYGDLEGDSSLSLDRDDGSQKHIVEKPSSDGFHVNVHKDFKMEISGGKPLPRTPVPGGLV